MTDREQKIADARRVLDFLEANEALPLPYQLSTETEWRIHSIQSTEQFIEVLAAMGDAKVTFNNDIWQATKIEKFGQFALGIFFVNKQDATPPTMPQTESTPAMFGTKLTDEPVGETEPAVCPHGLSIVAYCDKCRGAVLVARESASAVTPRKPKRIRITGCSQPELGYALRVGSEFPVSSVSNERYWIFGARFGVLKEDAEVIEWEPKLPSEVKIFTSSSPDYWYIDRMGCQFKVTGEQAGHNAAYWVVDDRGQTKTVNKEDCVDVDDIPF